MAKGNRWKDHYTSRAKEERWLARSVYKLEEIDKKYHLLRMGLSVLDLGCYPGSWSQYCLKKVGFTGTVMGIDLKQPEHPFDSNFSFIESDILYMDVSSFMHEIGFKNLVLSDMAPKTTGIAVTDAARSIELARKALEIAGVVLNKGGHFVCKVFEGDELKGFRQTCADQFRHTRLFRPMAVRKGSRELYVIGHTFISGN